MKVHYFNILLFSLPLNIILLSSQVYNQRNHILTLHKSTTTSRLLCECELYAPSNYDNDPEMKSVMQDFDRQTSQRFEEYNERLLENKQKCKEQCDKEIQKIILKDKLEKELMDKFATLHTDIQSDAIPTCVCEKSIADKVEKGCLKCGSVFGGIAPSVGLLGGLGIYVWKPGALKVAITAALNANSVKIAAAANAAGEAMGVKTVIQGLEALDVHKLIPEISKSFFNTTPYNDFTNISKFIIGERTQACWLESSHSYKAMCKQFDYTFGILKPDDNYGLTLKDGVELTVKNVVSGAEQAAKAKAAEVTTYEKLVIETTQEKAIETTSYNLYAAIGYSVLAILIIVLIMVIIYLILRYRRKKKMTKKLQYIKLLEE
ncbi:hypothetical protein PFTANZ_04197 [Plasmodium falciparum Tanzania (2000708)]|uniref:Surface antigen n=1 Tax=Plasmodium falciparum Tanzania (2000708) TaxID=1036725 RepID=A0A024W4I9_PLAFA|nr:hypothetical protein PFTANZ_04197 [Plasmodium falciparum Tanzania (2000708)]